MGSGSESATYFRQGFGLKSDVEGELSADYSGQIVDYLRANDYTLVESGITIRLAREFGFCYGVERAVEYAYQTRRKFPERPLYLVGEIIHNPHVNDRLREMGVTILERANDGFDFSGLNPDDVVILPAFGVTIDDFAALRDLGCVMVDTTCGSVLNVWKRVEAYARDRFTALIHGKHYHEETRATASQVRKHADGHYLVVRNMDEAKIVCGFIEGSVSRETVLERFAPHAVSPGFDPDIHLQRIGVANQTTMLASESLAIAAEVGASIERARGVEARERDFRSFDTICSATQERQDAVNELLNEPLDAMVVIGGFNSSNTISLTALCAERVPTYHVESPEGIDAVRGTIRHRLAGVAHREATTEAWLPPGEIRIGITAGASTPNSKIGEAVQRIFETRAAANADPSRSLP
jgi:4-hydroxy-3-methylbut-2-enyl diphosphate reductase